MRRSSALALLLALSTFGAGTAAAQQTPVRRTPQGIVLNFQDMDLAYVIATLAQTAGLNVVYSDLPTKNVTVRTTTPISPAAVNALIRDLAATNGIAITQQDGFLRLQGYGQATPQEPRQLFIQKLKHARAPVLAQTLQALFGNVIQAGSAAQAASTLTTRLRQIEQQSAQLQRQGITVGPQQFVIPQLRAGDLESTVTIVPDEVTNSLLVRATVRDWDVVQQAIGALDLRPLQVVIEVVIAEVRRTSDLNVGLTVNAERNDSRGSRTGSRADDNLPDNVPLRAVRHGDIDIDATLSAMSASGNVRILSRPVVLAQNNQEASIFVGSQQPFVQVSRSLPTDQATRDQIVQYQNVGTALTITPTINDDGYVNLQVVQEVSAATNQTQFDAPVISTREAATQLLARNGQTVVLGGLVDRQSDKSRSGIPFLKDIPILGYLFGSTRETVGTSELFLFLTPYIVATDDDADRLRREIESRSELLKGLVPVEPLSPPVVRIRPDTIRGDTIRSDTIRSGGR
jgi:general secretion pathway protein D